MQCLIILSLSVMARGSVCNKYGSSYHAHPYCNCFYQLVHNTWTTRWCARGSYWNTLDCDCSSHTCNIYNRAIDTADDVVKIDNDTTQQLQDLDADAGKQIKNVKEYINNSTNKKNSKI